MGAPLNIVIMLVLITVYIVPAHTKVSERLKNAGPPRYADLIKCRQEKRHVVVLNKVERETGEMSGSNHKLALQIAQRCGFVKIRGALARRVLRNVNLAAMSFIRTDTNSSHIYNLRGEAHSFERQNYLTLTQTPTLTLTLILTLTLTLTPTLNPNQREKKNDLTLIVTLTVILTVKTTVTVSVTETLTGTLTPTLYGGSWYSDERAF